ncbi:ICMT-domain-containing protein [Lentinula raphanica]|nr:ICMT-domain-containing protein [Lentinula raphanica]
MAPHLKILLLVGCAISYYISFTPPNSTNSRNVSMQVHQNSMFDKMVLKLSIYAKMMVTIGFLCEILVNAERIIHDASLETWSTQIICPLETANKDYLLHLFPEFAVGAILMLVGAALRVWCFSAMGQNFTFQVAIKPDHYLVKHGPYSYCRHPSYSGGFIQIIGLIMMHFSRGSWNQVCGIMLTKAGWAVMVYIGLAVYSFWSWIKRADFEDLILQQKFAGEWENYRRNVPYKFVPQLW